MMITATWTSGVSHQPARSHHPTFSYNIQLPAMTSSLPNDLRVLATWWLLLASSDIDYLSSSRLYEVTLTPSSHSLYCLTFVVCVQAFAWLWVFFVFLFTFVGGCCMEIWWYIYTREKKTEYTPEQHSFYCLGLSFRIVLRISDCIWIVTQN